jgi:hypothetical protein
MLLFPLLFALHLTPELPEHPYKQPQVAVAPGRTGLTYGSANTIYFAYSTDNGNTFSKPVVVAKPGVISLGNHRGPRIAYTGDGILISAISGKEGKGKDGDLLVWRSTDNGKNWSKPVVVNDVPAAAREGLHAMAVGQHNLVYAAWLDLRSKGMKLYGSLSKDGGVHWEANRLIYESPDGSICNCCHPSISFGPGEEIHVMWRNALGGSRDMFEAVSHDQGRTFAAKKMGTGTWPLNACPMDGGGMVVDREGHTLSVWRRAEGIYELEDGKAEKEIGRGKNPAVAAGLHGVYVAWNQGPSIQLLRPGAKAPVTLSESGAFVSLSSDGKNVIAAWEENGGVKVKNVSNPK